MLRQRVSRRFADAIKSVLLEMARQAVTTACELDEQGAVGDSAYEQAAKIRFIVCAPFYYPRAIHEAFSARGCLWRTGPLSREDPMEISVALGVGRVEHLVRGGQEASGGVAFQTIRDRLV
jgi:hypothetical protein